MGEKVAWRTWCSEEFGELGCRGHIHRERVSHVQRNMRSRCGGRDSKGISRARDEGMFEGGFGRTELGDVLLELGALAAVFDEEALITLVCDCHLLNHSIMFSFERCDLVRECIIRGCGVVQGLRPCREVNRRCHELCFCALVLCFEVYILSREFGVGLCGEFLLVAPRCLSSVELFGKFVASGLFSEQLLL